MQRLFLYLCFGLFWTTSALAQTDDPIALVYNSLEDPCDYRAFAESYPDSAFAPLAERRGESCDEADSKNLPSGTDSTAPFQVTFSEIELNTTYTKDLTNRVLEAGLAETLRREAEAGNPTAQFLLGYAIRRGYAPFEENVALGHDWVKKSCEADHPRGCLSLAFNLANGNGAPKDRHAAFDLFSRLCDEGLPLACEQVGNAYRNDFLTGMKDDTRANDAFEKACRGELGAGCRYAAWGYRNGKGHEKDLLKAMELYADGCLLGNTPACYDGGLMLEQDRTEDASDQATFEYLKSLYGIACGREHAQACFRLGDIYNNGRYSQTPNPSRAFELMTQACEHGSDNGCYNAGSWLISGKAWKKDGKRAIELLGPLCLRKENPDIQACNNAGTAAYRGAGMAAPDYVSARKFYEQACYQGALVDSCRTLADMLSEGQGGPADPGEWEWLNAQLCFKSEEEDYCKPSQKQHRIYALAQAGNYREARNLSGELCMVGDRLGCTFQETLNTCPSNAETRKMCAKFFE